jgi:hypothetical protein
MIEQLPSAFPKVLAFRFSGKLHDSDYQTFVPIVEAALRSQGKLRLLAHFHEFEGWDLHAGWDDLKFGAGHYADFERIAVIGDRQWQEWMTRLWRPFTRAQVRYFEASAAGAAWAWIRQET